MSGHSCCLVSGTLTSGSANTVTCQRSSGWSMTLSSRTLSMKRFLRITKELVILDFHRFSSVFDGDKGRKRHPELVEYINMELGEFMAPVWMGKGATMDDLWEMNRTLIVTYQDVATKNQHDNLWTEHSMRGAMHASQRNCSHSTWMRRWRPRKHQRTSGWP